MKNSIWMIAALLMLALGQVNAAEKVTYYHLDALGSPIAATDENGNLAWKEEYKPYGERIRKEAGDSNSTWYTGKQEDADNGLTYFGARWYDPTVGRFMGVDNAEVNPEDYRTFNRYAYAANNPYKYVDPDGNLFFVPFLAFIAKEIGSAVVEHYTGIPTGVKGLATKGIKAVVNKVAKGSGDKKPPIIIGENMKRVKEYADKTGGHAYRPWKNNNSDLAMKRNKRWIQDQRRQGRDIIDIGPDFQRRAATGVRSPFYEMERKNLKGYGKRQQVFKRSGSKGGVPGLDN
jgi:RHS repeat-associated protein